MSMHTLQNDEISISISTHGAELKSLKDIATGIEYLWPGDDYYWNRSSPILFPFVGALKNKQYHYQKQTYEMGQHGFARDMEFELIEKEGDEIRFRLVSTEETLLKYPFSFELYVCYRIEGRKVTILWEVYNTGSDTMFFSIGAHPAFYCPNEKKASQNASFFQFDTSGPLKSHRLNEQGLVVNKYDTYLLEDRALKINGDLFVHDALVIEGNQAQQVSLLGDDRVPYLTVDFDAPVFGLWSPPGKNAPFVCIEPWYGRCDGDGFEGSLEEREWSHNLPAGEVFKSDYSITIL